MCFRKLKIDDPSLLKLSIPYPPQILHQRKENNFRVEDRYEILVIKMAEGKETRRTASQTHKKSPVDRNDHNSEA